jgi:hypothetical protein
VQDRLTFSLDRQDQGYALFSSQPQEAGGLVELAEFLSLLSLRSTPVSRFAELQ